MAAPKKLPETLTPLECKALLAQPKPRYPTGLRDLCMLRLMLNTGLRSAECLSLKVRDIDWLSGKLMVREGKGKKDRTLWVNEDVLELLRKWRQWRPVDSALLFTTLQGKPVQDRALRAMVKRRAEKAGIPKHVHPYMLRHTFATEIYRQTKDIRGVQKMLGHADLSTTMIYTHIMDEQIENAMRGFNIE
jgi:site-specific recombinase XerD